MNALVTGGGGFLGGALVRRLLERGNKVRSFSRGNYPVLQALGVETLQGSLADPEAVGRAACGCDVLFHVAAKAEMWGTRRSFEEANVLGTRHAIDACRRHGVGRLVFTSSPSVVFDGKDQEGVDESAPYPDRFLAHYPRTKAESEHLVLKANGNDLATVALRPHLIWGPGDTHLVAHIISRAKSGKLRFIGGGENLIDTTYIDNAVEAHLLAAERLGSDPLPGAKPIDGRAFFITNDEPLPLRDVVNMILKAAGIAPVERTVPVPIALFLGHLLEMAYRILPLRGEPLLTRFVVKELSTAHWFDISAARRDLGYAPSVSLREGAECLRAWFEEEARK
jgi:2-alkyl-3-oxoalkanoate reductase